MKCIKCSGFIGLLAFAYEPAITLGTRDGMSIAVLHCKLHSVVRKVLKCFLRLRSGCFCVFFRCWIYNLCGSPYGCKWYFTLFLFQRAHCERECGILESMLVFHPLAAPAATTLCLAQRRQVRAHWIWFQTRGRYDRYLGSWGWCGGVLARAIVVEKKGVRWYVLCF